jgi:hypothetical protein
MAGNITRNRCLALVRGKLATKQSSLTDGWMASLHSQ